MIGNAPVSSFPTTSWTMLAEAGRGDAAARARLAEQYWRPVFAFLVRKGHREQDAADLTQAFFADVVLPRDLAHRADAHRGRFRTFLLAALGNFAIDAHRRVRRRDRREGTVKEGKLDGVAGRDGEDPVVAFERAWAATVLNLALERTRAYLTDHGYDRHWTVLEERVIRPTLHGHEPTSIETLARRLEVGPEKVSRLLFAARRRFRSTLRRVVAATVEDPADVEQELRHVRRFLGR